MPFAVSCRRNLVRSGRSVLAHRLVPLFWPALPRRPAARWPGPSAAGSGAYLAGAPPGAAQWDAMLRLVLVVCFLAAASAVPGKCQSKAQAYDFYAQHVYVRTCIADEIVCLTLVQVARNTNSCNMYVDVQMF